MAGAAVLLWFLCIVVPQIPAVQSYLGSKVSEVLSEKLATAVSVERVDFRLPNRIVVDGLHVLDQQGRDMLHAGRTSVSVSLMPLFEGRIRITSAQVFGMKVHLLQRDGNSPLNCQFIIDSLQSNDTIHHTPLDLSISSLIIRNSSISYDRQDVTRQEGRFSPCHLSISRLSSHIELDRLTDDSLAVTVRRMSFLEHSGIDIRELAFRLRARQGRASLADFRLSMPHTTVAIPSLNLSYDTTPDGSIREGSLHGATSLTASCTDFADLTPLYPDLSRLPQNRLDLEASAEGTDDRCLVTLDAISASDLNCQLTATLHNLLTRPYGNLNISRLHASEPLISHICSLAGAKGFRASMVGAVDAAGSALISQDRQVTMTADLRTSKAGSAKVSGKYAASAFTSRVQTPGLNLAALLPHSSLGSLACDLAIGGSFSRDRRLSSVSAKGIVHRIDYKGYRYRDIRLDGSYTQGILSGILSVDDPNVLLQAEGKVDIPHKKIMTADVTLDRFRADRLNLTTLFGEDSLSARLTATPAAITLTSDIADLSLYGNIDYAALPAVIMNIVNSRLPALTGKEDSDPMLIHDIKSGNDFSVSGTVKDAALLGKIIGIPLSADKPVTLDGVVNDVTRTLHLQVAAPHLSISGRDMRNTVITLKNQSDLPLEAHLSSEVIMDGGYVPFTLSCQADADSLTSALAWDNRRASIFRGTVNAIARFSRAADGSLRYNVSIPRSHLQVGDSLWHVRSEGITYADGALSIDRFAIGNAAQHVLAHGVASKSPGDSLSVDLVNVNVAYILNLVDFHSVNFGGRASGHLTARALLDEHNIRADGRLTVRDFLFEKGRMGTLHADVAYSDEMKRINIEALCDDPTASAKTFIQGFISPANSDIYLHIMAQNSRLEFMQGLCSSFMQDVDLHGDGHVVIAGPLNAIELTGDLVAKGDFTLPATSCRYTLPSDTVLFVPGDILLRGVPLIDKHGNHATVTGGIHHRHLGRMSYDIEARATDFLVYDKPTLSDEVFCGVAIIDGTVGIHGKAGELNIGARATPKTGTYITYNAATPDAIRSQDFITWRSADSVALATSQSTTHDVRLATDTPEAETPRTNIRMAFDVATNPNAKLHVLMDPITGDCIDLFGSGDLHINYYNKGTLDIYGNYEIDHGTYGMTIQNLLYRDFQFRKGGLITFGGDPYNATLNMQAVYKLNSVSLSDLNISNSLAANNVPVNCVMNVSGTPGVPRVTFGLDLPSLSSDARQIIYSIINSQEEMNQQVLYLLAIGRFYSESSEAASSIGSNSTRSTGQTTLAMQSFLSGTLSQQFNNIMSQVLGSTQWSFGANISPGDEGFNNAEYEGLLSGRLFNNRLLFNGQFGYRDNINTTGGNFIGDFTLQYLLTRNGNISLKAYNQSNDRYFIRNSLNTQGIGIMFQKEFGK